MEIRSLRKIWISGLLLAVLFITLPNQGLSRTVRTSKNTKSKEGLDTSEDSISEDNPGHTSKPGCSPV